MQSKWVVALHSAGRNPPDPYVRPPPTPVAPFGSASPLLSPTVRGAGVGDPCTLRPPRLTDAGASASPSRTRSSSPPPPPEQVACDDPLIADLIRMRAVPLPKLVFRGWRTPAEDWKAWVGRMARHDKFVKVWRAAGIEDAILNSTVRIRRVSQTVLALVGFWCPSTCTFVLPWGEVGFTLEDAHVLGNLPVWGSPLQRLPTDEEERLRLRLVEVREMLWKTQKESGHKARVTHSRWLNWFHRLDDDELQHLGFLAYWLSKSVLAGRPVHEVSSAVFGVAARLSRGERIALAPAVTASIYSDLTAITKSLYLCQGRKEGIKIEVWAQFRLLQAWLWERFNYLSPRAPDSINDQSRVRITRWDNKKKRMKYYEAVEAFCDSHLFAWRPYVNELVNWVKPQWYAKEEQSIVIDERAPAWVHDILAIVSTAGLVGLASRETMARGQYKPYRVSMQLGYDQAIPMSTDQLVTPWDSVTMCLTGVELYIPAMTRQCSTLEGYDEWWDNCARVLKVIASDFRKEMRKKRKFNDANNEDNSKSVCSQRKFKKRTRKKGRISDANNEDNSKNVFSDGKMKQFGLSGDEQADNNAEDSSKSVLEDGNTKKRKLLGDVQVANNASNEDTSKNVSNDGNTKKGRFSGDVEVKHDVNNESNPKNVSSDGSMQNRRLPRDVKVEHDINDEGNPKNVSSDDNTEERRLPGGVKLENESVCQGEPNFVEKPTNSTRDSLIKMLGDKIPNTLVTENEQDMKQKDQEHGPQTGKGAVDESDFDHVLVDELKELLTHGLRAELISNVNSTSSIGSSERSTKHDHRNATVGGHIVEAMSKCPKLFDMIPQYSHYLGILKSNVDEGMKKTVYTSLWDKLEELMQKVTGTCQQTKACEIKQLKKLGCDVGHLISQLNQPEKRLKQPELAKIAPEEGTKLRNNHLCVISAEHMYQIRGKQSKMQRSKS